MSNKSREKKKIYDLLLKNRMIFALVGSVVAVIAFFAPIFYDGVIWTWTLFIYGLVIVSPNGIDQIYFWLSDYPEHTTGLMVSLVSTSVAGICVAASIVIACYVLIRKRKQGVYSSRLILFTSFGLLTTVFSYLLYFRLDIYDDVNMTLTNWVGDIGSQVGVGTILFFVSFFLMLAGYTLRVKPLLMLLGLFATFLILYFSMFNLLLFLIIDNGYISTPPQDVLEWNFTTHLVPGIKKFFVALVIALVDLILHLRVKKKKKLLLSK